MKANLIKFELQFMVSGVHHVPLAYSINTDDVIMGVAQTKDWIVSTKDSSLSVVICYN